MKTKKKTPKTERGGTRAGAGRPPAHKVQLLVRLNPATAKKLRELASELELTSGQWLDQYLAGNAGDVADEAMCQSPQRSDTGTTV